MHQSVMLVFQAILYYNVKPNTQYLFYYHLIREPFESSKPEYQQENATTITTTFSSS